MAINLYAMYDVKSESFATPVQAKSDADAKRMLISHLSEQTPQKSMIQLYPKDFILQRIGVYDEETSKIDQADCPAVIMTGAQALEHVQSIQQQDMFRTPKSVDPNAESAKEDFEVPS
uniref:Nonstructural protein n=1 Tax=Chlamydiamicrovirus sp. TaxID=2832664 RepID=A0AB39A3A3_9VIRU